MNDLKTTKETFDTHEIENNTKALQELKKALDAYQESLNNSSTSQTSWLDQIKKIIVVMDTFKTITTKFQNVGRDKMSSLIHCYCFENADNNMCSLGY